MESLELGFQIDILGKEKRLEELTNACSQTLKKLHCTVVDLVFDENNPWHPPSIEHLSAFKKLKEINLNISYITDELLEAFASPDHCQMETIGVLSTCIEKKVTSETWTEDSKWQKLKTHSPGLKVNIHVYWPGIHILKHILKPVIPLHRLSVISDDEKLDPKFVDYVTTHFKDTLVDIGLHCYTALSLFWHDRFRLYSQPLVRLTEHGRQLKKVVVTGEEWCGRGDIS